VLPLAIKKDVNMFERMKFTSSQFRYHLNPSNPTASKPACKMPGGFVPSTPPTHPRFRIPRESKPRLRNAASKSVPTEAWDPSPNHPFFRGKIAVSFREGKWIYGVFQK